MLAAVGGLPVLALLVYAFAPVVQTVQLSPWQRELQHLPEYDSLMKKYDAYRNVPDMRDSREATCKMLAWIHKEASTEPGGKLLLAQMRPFQRERLESCRKLYPGVTETEAMEARRLIDQCNCIDRTRDLPQKTEPVGLLNAVEREIKDLNLRMSFVRLEQGATFVFWAGGFLWVIPVALSLIWPPSPAANFFGFALQTTSGKPASRWRCAARSFFAWLPFAVFSPLVGLMAFLGHAPYAKAYFASRGLATTTFWLQGYVGGIWMVDMALAGLIVLGTIYAVVKPERGLPDILAGTCLVPI